MYEDELQSDADDLAIAFRDYTTPPAQSLFSEEQLTRLTFKETPGLEDLIPPFAPYRTMIRYSFHADIPQSALGTLILPRNLQEVVPHLDDLKRIINDLFAAFQDGYRSVEVTFEDSGTERRVLYHFRKVTNQS